MKQSELRDMSGYTILDDSDFGDQNDKHWLLSTKETEDKIIKKTWHRRYFKSTDEYYESAHTEIAQKFICVNGPNAGQKLTLTQARPIGYAEYNCGVGCRRSRNWPRCVLVHSVFLTPNGMVTLNVQ